MTSMRNFRQVGTRGFYEPTGSVSFADGASGVATAIAYAHSLGLADIVVNTLSLDFPVPSVVDRYTLATRVVANAGGTLRVAFVARPEAIDFQKIGSVMMQNRGIIADTFATEAEALAWLDSKRMPSPGNASESDGCSPGSD
jgi:hypothetical protein